MKHYHIFGVRIVNKSLMERGILTLDFLIHYNEKENKNMELATDMSRNKINNSTLEESLKLFGVTRLHHQVQGAMMGAKANNLTVHGLITNIEMERPELKCFINICNIDENELRKLEESKIRNYGGI